MSKDETFLKYLEKYDIQSEDYPDVEWEDFKFVHTDTLKYSLYALGLALKELFLAIAEIIGKPILRFITNFKE